jgi:transcription elongation GreA/GreB family factor
MDRKELKQLVLNTLNNQIEAIQKQISSLSEDAQNDAKSSAGDKHETGLAMMHLEQEKLNAKLIELLDMQQIALKLSENKTIEKVVLGSIVKTNKAVFYLSVPMQPVNYKNTQVFCVSVHAPLIQHLLNKEIGHQVTFNNIPYKILEIY